MINPPFEIQLIFILFGLLVGSFLNVVIHRLPLGLSIVTPRSRCPKCNHVIKWYQNIPVLSYLFLRGRCISCKVRIPLRYVLVEIMMGIFAYLLIPHIVSINSILFFIFFRCT